RALPFAELKVDSTFVKDCATDANNAAICQMAIDLAPFRQRGGGGRRREHGRSAGLGRDGLRLRARHAGAATDAARTLP
ncbi:MAG TPA: hypothetical protein VFI81_03610, partial [Rhodanobacteraceae bacterium]|nr:hypothetical protein [Rhodanobacteraceae bacterium]